MFAKLIRKLKAMNKKTLIILSVVVVVAVVGGGYLVSNASDKSSTEQTQKQVDIANAALAGWRVKNDARLEVNKAKVAEFKQKLMNYYDPSTGALAEQQRLINALIAADEAAAKDDNSGEAIKSFDISSVAIKALDIKSETAKLTADVEYYIKYETQNQSYSTFGKNRINWELKKEGKSWKITKEALVPGDNS
ncbi:MAG TPA: hypothetical protein VGK02_05715 [Candidatus Aquicultor sp.]